MCGRVYQTLNVNQLLRAAGTNLARNQNRHQASYNIAPSNYVPAVRHHSSAQSNHRELDIMKWGYDAPFGMTLINARIEEAASKKTFQPLVNTSRCVVIIEGYYEWSPNKEPHVFRLKGEGKEKDLSPVMFLAALIAPDDTLIVFTREALRGLHEVHARMPVLLDDSEIDMWLDCKNYKFDKVVGNEIMDLRKDKWSKIYHYRVSPIINNIKNNSENNIRSIEAPKKDFDKTGVVNKWFQPTQKENVKDHYVEQEKKVIEDKSEKKATQSTQSTMATYTAEFEERKEPLRQKRIKTDVERAQERAERREKGLPEEDEEEDEEDDRGLNYAQNNIDKSVLGKDLGGFRDMNPYLMTNNKDARGYESKKRKDGQDSEEFQQTGRKMVKISPYGNNEQWGF